MRRPSYTHIPLSHERLAILLAFAGGAYTPAEVARQIIGDSVGGILIRRSSYFRLINELNERGYIDLTTYRLTEKGWKTIEHEAFRTEQWSRLARQRLRAQRYGLLLE
jgi:hypothetical protein